MRIRLAILGVEVFCLSVGSPEPEDDDQPRIGGGETHNFERDTTPLDPADHYGEWEFGFRHP